MTGLQYNRARYYDPTTGRWTTEDPIGFAGGDTNLYRYAGNNPTNRADPSGTRTIYFIADAFIRPAPPTGKDAAWLPEPGFSDWESAPITADLGRRSRRPRSPGSGPPARSTRRKSVSSISSRPAAARPAASRKLVNGTYQYDERKSTTVKGDSSATSVSNWDNKGINITQLSFTAAGNYPYVSISPDIDISVELTFGKSCSNPRIFVLLKIEHNLFPNYEVIVDLARRYEYDTPWGRTGILHADGFHKCREILLAREVTRGTRRRRNGSRPRKRSGPSGLGASKCSRPAWPAGTYGTSAAIPGLAATAGMRPSPGSDRRARSRRLTIPRPPFATATRPQIFSAPFFDEAGWSLSLDAAFVTSDGGPFADYGSIALQSILEPPSLVMFATATIGPASLRYATTRRA